jgi:hypothetical protein
VRTLSFTASNMRSPSLTMRTPIHPRVIILAHLGSPTCQHLCANTTFSRGHVHVSTTMQTMHFVAGM